MPLDPAAYYSDLTAAYERYSRGAHGWHYGVWEPGVASHYDALLRSNELLLGGLRPGPSTRVLDVGFGSGGFAVWAARRFDCRVTGITVCSDHVPLAGDLAARAGVGDRCRFLVMDMDRLDFPRGSFDVVVNQDTLCHARDKEAYLAAVAAVLARGGAWRAIDFSVQEDPLTPAQSRDYEVVCAGFHLPGMARASDVRRALAAAGFDALEHRDLTPHVRRAARIVRRHCYAPLALAALRLDWIVASRDRRKRAHCRGHAAAGLAYSRGLLAGHFRHQFYSARIR